MSLFTLHFLHSALQLICRQDKMRQTIRKSGFHNIAETWIMLKTFFFATCLPQLLHIQCIPLITRSFILTFINLLCLNTILLSICITDELERSLVKVKVNCEGQTSSSFDSWLTTCRFFTSVWSKTNIWSIFWSILNTLKTWSSNVLT